MDHIYKDTTISDSYEQSQIKRYEPDKKRKNSENSDDLVNKKRRSDSDNQVLPKKVEHPQTSVGGGSSAKYGDRYKLANYPKELTSLFGANKCKLCGVDLQSPIVGKMHYSGKQHIKQVKKYLELWSYKTGKPMPEIPETQTTSGSTFADHCDLCDIKLTSLNDKILHYSGKSHMINERNPLNAKRKNKNPSRNNAVGGRFGIGESFLATSTANDNMEANSSNQQFVCEPCGVIAVSEDQLRQHFSGKKHQEKMNKINSGVPKNEKPFQCSICDISLETESVLQSHLQGKRHTKNVLKITTSGGGKFSK